MHLGLRYELALPLNEYNMALERPKVTSVSPNSGTVLGGVTITVSGEEFVKGKTVLHIDGTVAGNISVRDSRTLTCETRMQTTPGKVSVSVRYDGTSLEDVKGDTYEYVR